LSRFANRSFPYTGQEREKRGHISIPRTRFEIRSTPRFIERGLWLKGRVPVLNKAPRHEDVYGEWRYSSTDSWPRH